MTEPYNSHSENSSFVHRYGSWNASQFLDYISENDGQLDHRISCCFTPLLTTYKHSFAEGCAPPILFVGSQSPQMKLFGKDWARRAVYHVNTPTDLKTVAAPGYHEAYHGRRVIEESEANLNIGGIEKYVHWFRILQPVTMPNGAKHILLFAERLDYFQQ